MNMDSLHSFGQRQRMDQVEQERQREKEIIPHIWNNLSVNERMMLINLVYDDKFGLESTEKYVSLDWDDFPDDEGSKDFVQALRTKMLTLRA